MLLTSRTKRKKLLRVPITHLQHSMLPPLLSALCQIKGNIPLNLKYAPEWGSVATGPICQADKLSHSMMGTGLRQAAWVPAESLPAPSPGCQHFFLPVVTLHWLLPPHFPSSGCIKLHSVGEELTALRTENIPLLGCIVPNELQPWSKAIVSKWSPLTMCIRLGCA